ncbi:MAG: hypothetical protein ACI4OW_04685 [Alphaproteobacteria bacterium]
MNKDKYITSQTLDMYLAAQKSIPHNFKYYAKSKNYFEENHTAIVKQSLDFINDFLSGKNEVSIQDIDKVSNLIEMIYCTSDKKLQLQTQKLRHRFEIRKANLECQNENLKKLNNIQYIEKILNTKKIARSLSPEELLVIKKTLDAEQEKGVQHKKLMQKLNAYALLVYSQLKKDKEFTINNPVHKKLEDNFGFRHVRLILPNSPQVVGSSTTQKIDIQKEKTPWFQKIKNRAANLMEKISDWASEKKSYLKHQYYKHEAKIAAGFFALSGLLFAKVSNYTPNTEFYHSSNSKTNTEILTPKTSQTQDTAKTIDFKNVKQIVDNVQPSKINVSKAVQEKNEKNNETTLCGDYYDTALEIHLRSKQKVLSLYHKIDSLANTGKIEFSKGTNTKRYAHAITMYQLIKPNSEESKTFEKLFKGDTVEKDLLNELVLKAGKRGNGIKTNSNIRHSNFDNAPQALKNQHIQNLHNCR